MCFNLVLFILALALFVYFSWQRTVWGLAAIIVLLPSYLWRLELCLLPTSFLELMVVSLFIVWLLKKQKFKNINWRFWQKANNEIPVVGRYLLALWLLVSLFAWWANPTYSALGIWRAYFLEPMMFFLVFIYSVKNKDDLRIIIRSAGLLIAWLFVLAIYQNFSNWNFIAAYNYPNVKRITSVFPYPNALSLLTAPLSAFFLGLWLTAKNKLKDVWKLVIALFGFSLAFLAVSEGAMLALGVSFIFYLVLAKKIRKYTVPIFGVLFIIVLLSLPTARYLKSLSQQLFHPVLDLEATSLEIRASQWQETGQMLQDNFLSGAGLLGYQDALKNYHQHEWLEIYLYPHNIFLNFWSEMGFVGLLAFLGLMVYIVLILKKLFFYKHNMAWPLTMMWLTWFVHGLVDVPYFKNDLSILFFVMLGLTIFSYKKIK